MAQLKKEAEPQDFTMMLGVAAILLSLLGSVYGLVLPQLNSIQQQSTEQNRQLQQQLTEQNRQLQQQFTEENRKFEIFQQSLLALTSSDSELKGKVEILQSDNTTLVEKT
eukprot:CAMPEP_0119101594 /NCGR_PEP_ID=MMETSP1180-20130426/611_1 /TAXON_ID=3052 ORGANISM="Chlamydomonas cf sp, Strain CCMP681" /NCGR_SAMPLE_ID=MMETSP1180 /ASSEMBLY_ACC=CAM_ASM_000741 /LENGTH=109 /DNA_ID=CAMNT_0007085739 /DNA_START=181 /DNA_END=510 /DNA_ORIENTATION=-